METITSFFSKLLETANFPPRWHCGEWTEFHGWLYIGSNLAVWSAYFAIPLIMLYFFVRKRSDIPFPQVVVWFVAFILFCGLTHLVDAIIFWQPVYRLNALLLFGTGVVSWSTAFGLIRVLPKAMEFKSPEALQQIINEQTAELREINRKLAESEARFKALVNNNPDIIAEFDLDLKHIFVNQAGIEETQLPQQAILGKRPDELYPKEIVDFYQKQLEEVKQTEKSVHYEVDTEPFSPTVNPKYFYSSAIPIKDGNHETTSILHIARDISKQKEAEKALKKNYEELQSLSEGLSQKNHQLENFAYIVSHNLRSPMGNLTTLLELYKVETAPDEKVFLFGKLEEVIEHLNQTINDLTEVVQIQQNTSIERSTLQFEAVLEQLISSLYTQIEDADIQITHDFTACSSILYPKIYLESILQNLLTNGIKYRSEKRASTIHFETKWKEGRILLRYTDNGLGIDLAKYGKKIFGLNKTFHKNTDARGVGLFITKNQIEALRGSITVQSAVDVGTTFEVWFDSEASLFSL